MQSNPACIQGKLLNLLVVVDSDQVTVVVFAVVLSLPPGSLIGHVDNPRNCQVCTRHRRRSSEDDEDEVAEAGDVSLHVFFPKKASK